MTLDGGPYPSASAGPIYNLSDNFTWTHGTHTIKFGGLWEYSGQNDFDQINVERQSRAERITRTAVSCSRMVGRAVRALAIRKCCARSVRHICRTRHTQLHAVSRQHVRVLSCRTVGKSRRS